MQVRAVPAPGFSAHSGSRVIVGRVRGHHYPPYRALMEPELGSASPLSAVRPGTRSWKFRISAGLSTHGPAHRGSGIGTVVLLVLTYRPKIL
jgi:hypothetical protein